MAAAALVASLGGCTFAPDPPDQPSPPAESAAPAPTATTPRPPAYAAVLEEYSAKMRAGGATAVIIQVKSRFGEWSSAAGVRSLESQEPVELTDQVHVGDITMSMVAVSVLKLVDERKVGLDDPITEHLPDLEKLIDLPGPVTVRSLLSHRSGMPHYWDGLVRMGNTGDQRMTHEERLATAATVRWETQGIYRYSNTNYSALALLIEKLRGRKLGEVLRTDIADPLGLTGTVMTGSQTSVEKLVHGYFRLTSGELVESTLSPFFVESADVGMISTVPELNIYFAALQKGALVSATAVTEMSHPKYLQFGLGLVRLYDECSNNSYFGHIGVVRGYGTLALISADGSRQVAVAVAREPTRNLVGFDDQQASGMADMAVKALNLAC
jgi:D-alanyl-D-alanine carboxypeptidase